MFRWQGVVLLAFSSLGFDQTIQSNLEECQKTDVPCVVVTHLRELGIGTLDVRGRWKLSKHKNQVYIHCDRIESVTRTNEHDLTEKCSEAIAEIDADRNPVVHLYTYFVGAKQWRDAEALGQITVQTSSAPCTTRTLVIAFAGSVALLVTPKTDVSGCKNSASNDQMGSYFPRFKGRTTPPAAAKPR